MKRQFNPACPEWMDRPQPISRALERDLANLRSFNRWFGSYRLVQHFLARWLSAGIYLLTAAIYREPMTRNDARVSAARAFSFREMHELAERAGWKNFGHRRFAIGRQAIWLDPSENNRSK